MAVKRRQALATQTGGRDATTGVIPGRYALSVGMPDSEPPKGWQWTPLSAVARLESGHTPSRRMPDYWDGDIPWVGIRDATENHGRTISTTNQTVTQAGIDNSSARILPAGTVCLSRTASVGYVVVMGRPMATSQDFVNWVCSDAIDKHFLKYVLLAEHDSMLRFASGTTHQTIYYPEAKAFHVCLPKKAEQVAIAHILGTLDDKIELNRRMNETLEATARAFFKSWFVDFDPVRAKAEKRQPAGMDAETAALFPSSFEETPLGLIPKRWRVATLDDITESALGGDWGNDAPAEDASDAALCIRGADIPDLQKAGVGKMPVRYLKCSSLQKRSLRDGDLVIEISGGSPTQSTGRPVLIRSELLEQLEYPLVCSNFCRMVRLSNNASPIFAYLWLRWLYASDAFLQYENGTTGIKNFAFSIFSKQFNLALPPPELLKKFEGQVGLLFKKQAINGAQSRTLAALRDTLLPKLLSGEIRVREAEREVEQVA